MELYEIMTMVITMAVAVAYLNHRYIGMPTTIGIMLGALLFSLILLIAANLGFNTFEHKLEETLGRIDFNKLLIDGMLSFLLFAGALTVDIKALRNMKWEVGILATVSTIVSTLIIGTLSYHLLNALHINIDFIYCMLFGALISPTDPIAVLAIFKRVGAPRNLDVAVAGESLFNDGVGIVLFLTLYHVAFSGADISFQNVSTLFLQQAIGGIIYGALLGFIGYKLIKPINDGKIEILITIAITTGGYVFAHKLGISGPLAMVVAGIFIGNHHERSYMSEKTRDNLDTFWELVDEILNAILFLLIGLELLLIKIDLSQIIAALLAIPLVLLTRYFTVGVPMNLFKLFRSYPPHTINILTWGGLRGGLAVALALALPPGQPRDVILTMTYAVVIFAIAVQGSTMKSLARRARGES